MFHQINCKAHPRTPLQDKEMIYPCYRHAACPRGRPKPSSLPQTFERLFYISMTHLSPRTVETTGTSTLS